MKKNRFLGVLNPATAISLCGLIFSFLSVIYAAQGKEKLALIFFVLTPLFDFFDGPTARITNKSEREFEFGGRLDPMLDLVNFGFSPAIMFYLLGYSHSFSIICLVFFLLCGAERQGDPDGGKLDGYFSGLPIPYGVCLTGLGWVGYKITGIEFIFTAFLLLTSFLFILRFPFRVQTGVFYILWPTIAMAAVALIWFHF